MNKLSDLLKTAANSKQETGITFFTIKNGYQFISYKMLYENSSKIANSLVSKGILPGDKIAIILPTCPEFIELFFAISMCGAIPSALYPPLRLGKLDEWKDVTTYQLNKLSATLVVTEKRILPLARGPVIDSKVTNGILNVQSLYSDNSKFNEVDRSFDDICFIQFSSGTTGRPKGVQISNRNLLSNIEAIVKSLDIQEGIDKGVSWLPLYHDMGLVGALLTAIYIKSDQTLIRPEEFLARPVIWPQAISDQKATITVAPNFAYGLINRKVTDEAISGMDLSTLKIALNGAENVFKDTIDSFNRKFSKAGLSKTAMTPVYGMSETTLATTFSSYKSNAVIEYFNRERLEVGEVTPGQEGFPLVSLGPAVFGMNIEIRDEDNNKTSENRVGKLFVKGSSITSGYLGEKKLVESDGFFDSGDRGFIYNNQLFLYGRNRDIIIKRGKNFDPASIEFTVGEHAMIRPGCCVVTSSQEEKTEKIFIFAELAKEIKDIEISQIKNSIKTEMVKVWGLVPDEISLLKPNSLPRTSSGKLKRKAALAMFKDNTLHTYNPTPLTNVIKLHLYGIAKKATESVKSRMGH